MFFSFWAKQCLDKMVGSITFTKIPLSLFALISWSPKRAHWCFSELQWCVLSLSGSELGSLIIFLRSPMFASSVSCLCLIHGLECSCDQCLFTSTPSLSRSHESDSLPVCTVCLFKIALHLICAICTWCAGHSNGGYVMVVWLFCWLVAVCESWDSLQFSRASS